MRPLLAVALVAALPAQALTQDAEEPSAPDEAPEWDIALSTYLLIVPQEVTYPLLILAADREWLHLEARYDYEDLQTGSVWTGANFEVGDVVSLSFTPTVGLVFGLATGIAVGFSLSLEWRWLSFYSEGEVVFDEESFIYSWSELTLSPVEWLIVGTVVQRTRVYQTEREVQVGAQAGVSFDPIVARFMFLDPALESRTFILALDIQLE